MTTRHALVVGLVVLGGCGDDNEEVLDQGVAADLTAATPNDMAGVIPADLTSVGDAATQMAVTLTTMLTGAQETPPNNSVYTGASTVIVNGARDQISVTLTHNIPGGTTTAAHIHIGAPGVAGPIIFPLAAGQVSSPLNRTLTAADLTPQPGAQTFADAVNAILAGQTYVNVHSMSFPAGEIRGQLVESQ